MSVECERKRVLVAARAVDAPQLLTALGAPALKSWEVLEAETFEKAHFILQHSRCDVLVVDEALFQTSDRAALDWLTSQREVQAVFLGGNESVLMTEAFAAGATICLPRQAALTHPELLSAALHRAADLAQRFRAAGRIKDAFHQCRRQVDRLVHLLWRTTPLDPQRHWFTQRHLLERMQEEVARCGRHGMTFTVALGEVQSMSESSESVQDAIDWTADILFQTKRRCDVAGSYGLNGFMLLMVQTPTSGGVVCCRRLQNRISDAARTNPSVNRPVRACFGLSTFRKDSTTMQSLLSRAEKNLDAARSHESSGVVADLAASVA